MLTISVEFLHGTFRADPSGAASTGRLSRGEWPPAPARLFSALVAAAGTRQRCSALDDDELRWLEQQPPPTIFACTGHHHQRLRDRFVVRHKGNAVRGSHQEYLGRTGAQARPGVRVAIRDPHVTYRWGKSPGQRILDALQYRAARIGYLGTSDSPVRVRVATTVDASADPKGNTFIPGAAGNTLIRVSGPGDLELLDQMYDIWVQRGASMSRMQFPALRHEASYHSPRSKRPQSGAVVAWLRLTPAISGRRISALTAIFKAAILKHHQRIHGEPPPILHGHGFGARGYEIARFLALPDVNFRYSRGLIHGLAIWVPRDCDDEVRAKIRDAAFAIRRLAGSGVDVAVAPRAPGGRPKTIQTHRWCRKSRSWVTAIPAIHERRKAVDLAEVTRWCHHAGLPNPIAFRSKLLDRRVRGRARRYDRCPHGDARTPDELRRTTA